jgi:hypothetical protein
VSFYFACDFALFLAPLAVPHTAPWVTTLLRVVVEMVTQVWIGFVFRARPLEARHDHVRQLAIDVAQALLPGLQQVTLDLEGARTAASASAPSLAPSAASTSSTRPLARVGPPPDVLLVLHPARDEDLRRMQADASLVTQALAIAKLIEPEGRPPRHGPSLVAPRRHARIHPHPDPEVPAAHAVTTAVRSGSVRELSTPGGGNERSSRRGDASGTGIELLQDAAQSATRGSSVAG